MVLIVVFVLVGCKNNYNIITDLPSYSTMIDVTEKIEVSFDNNFGDMFNFIIENKEEINDIMKIVLSKKLEMQNDLNDINHTIITIYQGENKYMLNTSCVSYNNKYYYFKTNNLIDKINELANNAGAYNK